MPGPEFFLASLHHPTPFVCLPPTSRHWQSACLAWLVPLQGAGKCHLPAGLSCRGSPQPQLPLSPVPCPSTVHALLSWQLSGLLVSPNAQPPRGPPTLPCEFSEAYALAPGACWQKEIHCGALSATVPEPPPLSPDPQSGSTPTPRASPGTRKHRRRRGSRAGRRNTAGMQDTGRASSEPESR